MSVIAAAESEPGPKAEPKAKIFISYSRKDMPFADRLEAALRERGFEPMIDRTEIYAFEDWWVRIQSLIVRADTVIFVLSPGSVASDVCAKEVEFAASLNKRFAPIVVRRIDDKLIPAALERLNFIFFDEETLFASSLERLCEALQTDIGWIRKHTDYADAARRWQAGGRPSGLLLRSPVLEDAERWIAARPSGAPAPTEETQALIAASRHGATRRRNILTGSLAAGLVLALALAGLAYWQRGVAVEQRKIAIQQRDKALLRQSQYLADVASRRIAAGDSVNAMALGIEALPDAAGDVERPYSVAAEAALFNAERHRQENRVFGPPPAKPRTRPPPAAFSPDGHLAAIALGDAVHIVDSETGMTVAVLSSHSQWVGDFSFSPDGQRLVANASDKTLRVWEIPSGKQLVVLTSDDDPRPLGSPIFSPDGRRIAAIVDDTMVRVWTSAGTRLTLLKGHTADITSLSYAPDNWRIVTSSRDKTARIWDAESGEEILKYSGHESEDVGDVRGALFSPDGKRVLTIAQSAQLWDSTSGAKVAETPTVPGHIQILLRAGFSPDGKRFVTASSDHTAQVWTADTAQPIAVLHHEQAVQDAEFSADGSRVVTAAEDHTARIWEAGTGTLLATLGGHTAGVWRANLSRDGRHVLTEAWDGTARLWSADPVRATVLNGNKIQLSTVSFSPDGRRVVTASWDETARIWDVASGKQLKVFEGHSDIVNSAAFSPDAQYVLTASSDKTARIWNSETGEQIMVLAHDRGVGFAAFSPDGKRIVTKVGRGGQIWDRDSGRTIATLPPYSKTTYHAPRFSPDGRRVLTSGDYLAHIWDSETGNLIVTLTGHTLWVMSAAFSPDGRRVVTASADGTARIWDSETGKQLMVLAAYRLDSAQFSRDGQRVVTASEDGTAQIWNADTGAMIEVLRGHLQTVEAAIMSPDGRLVVTSAQDNTVRLWDAATGVEIGVLDGQAANESTSWLKPVFSPDGQILATPGAHDDVRLWRLFPTTQALVDAAKDSIPRCLTRDERRLAFLDPEPPDWCIEREKWPYAARAWKDWLADKRAGKNRQMPEPKAE
jgi:WD40 repeat protein